MSREINVFVSNGQAMIWNADGETNVVHAYVIIKPSLLSRCCETEEGVQNYWDYNWVVASKLQAKCLSWVATSVDARASHSSSRKE